mgnify:CR=1 FL=1
MARIAAVAVGVGKLVEVGVKFITVYFAQSIGGQSKVSGGWDTHGLPVEVEVCKAIGIHSKAEIEAYGVEPFIHECQKSVWRYMREWESVTERIGFWIDLSQAYVTYHKTYVESVWWALSMLHAKELLYQGHKILPYCPRCGTSLRRSAGSRS